MAPRAGRAQQRERVADRRGVGAQPREQRAEDARARLGVGQRAVRDLDVDAQRLGQRPQPALAGERVQPARQRDRAQHRRRRPVEAGAREGLGQHAAVERPRCGRRARARGALGELGQRRLGRRRLVDHRLRDPGEALDAARQRRADAHQRLPAVVQLAPADEHGADLGDLARVARQAVRLRVDDQELRAVQGRGEIHGRWSTRRSGRQDSAIARPIGSADREDGYIRIAPGLRGGSEMTATAPEQDSPKEREDAESRAWGSLPRRPARPRGSRLRRRREGVVGPPPGTPARDRARARGLSRTAPGPRRAAGAASEVESRIARLSPTAPLPLPRGLPPPRCPAGVSRRSGDAATWRSARSCAIEGCRSCSGADRPRRLRQRRRQRPRSPRRRR